MKRVSLKDIAAETGYSCSTVCSALKNRPNISKNTAELIQKTAEELGYSPNPVFSELGRQRWKRSDSHRGENLLFLIHNDFLIYQKECITKLKSYAFSKGYHLEVIEEYPTIDQANREFFAKGIRGIMSDSTSLPQLKSFFPKLNYDHLAIITGEGPAIQFHTISWDWGGMVFNLLKELHQRGYKKVSAFFPENKVATFFDLQRFGAFAFAQDQFSMEINLHRFEVDVEAGDPISIEERTRRILEIIEKDQPDAFLGWSEWEYWMLKEQGYTIPRDFGFVSLITPGSCSGCCGTTGYRFHLWKVQFDQLISLIYNQDFGVPEHPVTTLFTPPFYDGGTA